LDNTKYQLQIKYRYPVLNLKIVFIYGRRDGNTEITPWSPVVISSEEAKANFQLDHVTVDDFTDNNIGNYRLQSGSPANSRGVNYSKLPLT
jgi:hypothetical protein